MIFLGSRCVDIHRLGGNYMFGWRGRIGLIIPSNNTLIEPELNLIVPNGISIHVARILTEGCDTESIDEMVKKTKRAALELSAGNMNIIVYCCLLTTLIKGINWSYQFAENISKLTRCPLITAYDATVSGIKECKITNIGLVSAYSHNVQRLLIKNFKNEGIKTIKEFNIPINNIFKIPNINPIDVYKLTRKLSCKELQGVCIAGTDLPSFSIIETAESDLNVPVITTNQAILNAALKRIGLGFNINNYGKLLVKNNKMKG